MTTSIHKRALLTPSEPADQATVDRLQAQIRADLAAGRRSLFKPAPPEPAKTSNVLDKRIAEELELVTRQLDQLGDVLSDDPVFLHRYTAQLQSIDLMQQVLGHLGRIVASEDKPMAVDQTSLTELRSRLTRKALRLAE
jgi:hypothetical protein